MALYLPDVQVRIEPDQVASLMLEHACGFLRSVGYGSAEGPFLHLGVGVDLGEAFVGNIGQRALYDFTAVGDVVNTASRLQGTANGGEIVLSRRVAENLSSPVGVEEELTLKGRLVVEMRNLEPLWPPPPRHPLGRGKSLTDPLPGSREGPLDREHEIHRGHQPSDSSALVLDPAQNRPGV